MKTATLIDFPELNLPNGKAKPVANVTIPNSGRVPPPDTDAASSVPTNSSPGTCLPSTTRHTVSGVASSSPTGPQRNVQNTADTRIATVEMPVLVP